MNVPSKVTICHLDIGKKKKCRAPVDDDDTIQPCATRGCDNFIHLSCSKLMLDHNSVAMDKRPDPETEPFVAFCKKTCHNEWRAARKREAKAKAKEAKESAKLEKKRNKKSTWDADGTLQALLDRLTTEPNYSNCCGGDENTEGKRKQAFHVDIAKCINDRVEGANIGRTRVQNKITSLERTWREAHDWTQNTGEGVSDEADFKSASCNQG